MSGGDCCCCCCCDCSCRCCLPLLSASFACVCVCVRFLFTDLDSVFVRCAICGGIDRRIHPVDPCEFHGSETNLSTRTESTLQVSSIVIDIVVTAVAVTAVAARRLGELGHCGLTARRTGRRRAGSISRRVTVPAASSSRRVVIVISRVGMPIVVRLDNRQQTEGVGRRLERPRIDVHGEPAKQRTPQTCPREITDETNTMAADGVWLCCRT